VLCGADRLPDTAVFFFDVAAECLGLSGFQMCSDLFRVRGLLLEKLMHVALEWHPSRTCQVHVHPRPPRSDRSAINVPLKWHFGK
jgi:hypothetical protein